MSLKKAYHDKIEADGLTPDSAQEKALKALEMLVTALMKQQRKSIFPFSFGQSKQPLKGLYLYGGVGRGKSMIMDLFFSNLPASIKKRRVHFHAFMIEAHDWLHANRQQRVDDLLPRYALEVSKSVTVLCFDEFHITDIADAMIVGRLFTALFDQGVTVVATSNWHPDHLYEGGLQRDLFLPFIALLKDRMDVLHLDSGIDYRQISDPDQELYYFSPLNEITRKKIDRLFIELTGLRAPAKDFITVKGREITVFASGPIARFKFSDLCEKPLGAEDYLTLAARYHTIFIDQIPIMQQAERNALKRFILLIDCLYEAKCRVIISADADIDRLYEGDDHAFEFVRTISRLVEMQSLDYHLDHKKRISE